MTGENPRLPAATQDGPVLVDHQGAALRAAPAGVGLDADSAQDVFAVPPACFEAT